jgi:hypothetical protein
LRSDLLTVLQYADNLLHDGRSQLTAAAAHATLVVCDTTRCTTHDRIALSEPDS